MEWDQIEELLEDLQAPYSRPLTDAQVKVLSEWLEPKDYRLARRCIEVATSKPGQWVPTKGDLCKAWEDVSQEGVPNAPGQSTGGGLNMDLIRQQNRLEHMSDEEYQAYLAELRRARRDGT
jgi:hypothetical protein